jgi:hypothetical protein
VAFFPQNIKAYLSQSKGAPSLNTVPEVAKVMKSAERPLAFCYNDTPKLFELAYPFAPFFAQWVCSEMQHQGFDVTIDALPSAPSIAKHLRPGITTVRRTKAGIECTTRQTLPGGNIGVSLPMCAMSLFPVQHLSRPSADLETSKNRLKQLGVAVGHYAKAHRVFPPTYRADKESKKPLLSWRVSILPYLGHRDLYDQFHLDEPWDSEHNKKLIEKMPEVFRAPGGKAPVGHTNYLTVRGDQTLFPGARRITFRDIRDGTSHTIMLVEASDAKSVPWTKPVDYEYDPENPSAGLVGLRTGGFLICMADGSVFLLREDCPKDVLDAAYGRAEGKRVPLRDYMISR